jgi:NADPH:quinone reductase-like Zn-dependent oxidoreductase
MKAIVQDGYGPPEDVLELKDIEAPVVKDDKVLVRVHAASVHADVWHVVTGLPYVLRIMGAGLRRPKNPVPGTDVAGVIESVGAKVTRFQPGDEVFGETIKGMQWVNGGAYAEYAVAPEDGLALKPANVTFEQAAAVPTSALIAYGALKGEGKIQAGQKVLVNGAGGGVGSFAVQLAKALGAEVTGVDSTGKLEMVRSLGADHVIDYTQEDFTRRGERFDLIFDIPGNHSFAECKRALMPGGTYVLIGHDNYGKRMRRWVGLLPHMFKLMAMSPFVKQLPTVPFSRPPRAESMAFLKELLESGKLKPNIDRTYTLSQVPEAIRYLQDEQVKGKVIITV